jgi:ABC-type uncharacterized transport system substrate-binding protein
LGDEIDQIPIVFAVAVGLLGAGMVASLAGPDGNVTDVSVQQAAQSLPVAYPRW